MSLVAPYCMRLAATYSTLVGRAGFTLTARVLYGEPPELADLQNMIQGFIDWETAGLTGYYTIRSDTTWLTQVSARSLDPASPCSWSTPYGNIQQGGTLDLFFGNLPAGSCPIALWNCSPEYRRRGRTYLPCLTQAVTAETGTLWKINGLYREAIQSTMNQLIDFMRLEGNCQLVHLQTTQSGVVLPVANVFDIHSADLPYVTFGTQRRRLRP